MPIEIPPPNVIEQRINLYRIGDSPQEILARIYESAGPLPIRGGWGYSQEDAVVIDRHHPVADPDAPFDGIGVEYAFVQLRIWEELIGTRPKGRQHRGCQRKLIRQSLRTSADGRKFDHMLFDVTALPKDEFEELKALWEANLHDPDYDRAGHIARHKAAQVHYVAEYWFDISSFYGQ